MSISTVVDSSSATLISSAPAMLLSVFVGTTNPPPADPAITIEFHNANSASDTLDSSNLKAKMSIGTQGFFGLGHQFDGIMFPKGMVIKCSAALPITVEYE